MADDPTFRALRQQYEETLRLQFNSLWDPRRVSDGAVRPSRDRMEERQEQRFPEHPGAWRTAAAAEKSVDEICTRFKHQLKPALDPRFRLHAIVHPIAEFLVAFDKVEPFGTRGHKALVSTSLHDCCKFAGCPPPPDEESGPNWRDILYDRKRSDPSRIEALTDLFHSEIGAEISGPFAASMETGRVKAHRARKRRRAAVARRLKELGRI